MSLSCRPVLVLAFVLALLVGAPPPAMAQEASGYPASIQQGTCDALGEVAFELTGVGAATAVDGSPVPAMEPAGVEGTRPVLRSVTTLDVAVTDLTAAPHALVVRAPDEPTRRVVACGELGGMMTSEMPGMLMPGDELAIALWGQDGSDVVGIALLTANGGSAATVRIYLVAGAAADDA